VAETVLLTGGAGFIGAHLAGQLLERGAHVRVLDCLHPQVHGDAARPAYLDDEVELVPGDVRDPEAVRGALAGVDAVVHLAARVGVGQSMYEIAEYTSANTGGTAVLLEALLDHPVGRLVVASSMSVYGEGLYVDERIDDDEIGRRYGVSTWTVRQRLRIAGIRRPNGVLPGGDIPVPSGEDLHRLYETEQRTLANIGALYGVPDRTVRRWIETAGIPLRERPRTAGRRPDGPLALDRRTLFRLYVTEGHTAAEIAAEVGVTKNIVTTVLHAQRIPVRPSGPSQKPPVVLLDALYADPNVTAVLAEHGIPIRPDAGELRERWPEQAEMSAEALEALYVTVGLSAAHISMLTGIQVAGVRHRLQRAGHTARGSGRSPWKAERADIG